MKLLGKFAGLLLGLGLAANGAWAGQVAVLNNGFSIRHDHHVVLNQTTRLYLTSGNGSYVDVPTAEIVRFEKDTTPKPQAQTPATARQDVNEAVSAASARHQLDSDFISSVIHAESGFNPHAVSPKGAEGLMQLMPGTASKLGVENPFDPTTNVDGGTQYLRELLDNYHGDMAKALAAYNAGPQRVAHYNGIPPYRETHAYVARVIREFNRKKLAEQRAQSLKRRKSSSRAALKGKSATAVNSAAPAAKRQSLE